MILSFLKQLRENGATLSQRADMVWCAFRYGASPNNYRDFNFSELNARERATYVTNRLSRKMIRAFNQEEYTEVFEDKTAFAQKFHEFFQRDWLSSSHMEYTDFLRFAEQKERFICKPIDAAQGRGISVYENLSDTKAVFQEIKAIKGKAILEEWIQQHKLFQDVYDQAVNCLRIITVYKDGNVKFLGGGSLGETACRLQMRLRAV